MLVQYLNLQSEIKQHIMGLLFFLVFILYSLYTQLGISLWILFPLFFLCIVIVFVILRNQAKLRTQVQIQVIEKSNKHKILERKIQWIIIPFILYALLTAIHFYIVYLGTGDLIPLIYDYGLGGILAIVFNFYLLKNWYIGICDEGIIMGSKLDAKLIKWENISSVDYSELEIILKNTSIKKIKFTNLQNQKVFTKLLKYKFL